MSVKEGRLRLFVDGVKVGETNWYLKEDVRGVWIGTQQPPSWRSVWPTEGDVRARFDTMMVFNRSLQPDTVRILSEGTLSGYADITDPNSQFTLPLFDYYRQVHEAH